MITYLARWAFMIGALGLLMGYLFILTFPQRPDGDSTALTLFEAQYGGASRGNGLRLPFGGQAVPFGGQPQALPVQFRVRESLWFNGAGALFAWGTLYFLLYSMTPKQALDSLCQSKLWTPIWLSLLIIWMGWAWNQTRGWQGQLYLAPGEEKLLGVDQTPTIVFERFLLPPAPDGAGRALRLRLFVEGQPYDIAEATPYQAASWTLTPRWYGAILNSDSLIEPLFFGASGASEGLLRDGRKVVVTVNVEALTVSSVVPLQEITLTHYAILDARFAPGDRLLTGGVVMLIILLLHWLSQLSLGIITTHQSLTSG